MINGKRVAVVIPAYNMEKTLENTVSELPELVDIRTSSMTRVPAIPANSPANSVSRHSCAIATTLWAQPADLLSRSPSCWRRYRRDGVSRLFSTPVLVTAMASMIAYGVYDWSWALES
jgi:hypothetical protein